MSITAAAAISAVIGFAVTAALGFVVIPWLHKLKFGQTILDIGPKWHKKKQGTPNMGGLMFIAGIFCAFIISAVLFTALGGNLETEYSAILTGREKTLLIAGLMLALGCGIVGFADDFTKIKLKRNEGLTPKQKTIGQLVMTIGYVATLWISKNTIWYFPFIGTVDFSKNFFTGIIFWALSIVIVYGCVNSVNLTDGIDGLCPSVTLTVSAAFTVIAFIENFAGLGILSTALLGAMCGFLCWNWNPAKVFMGDTGSLFLGGLVVSFMFVKRSVILFRSVISRSPTVSVCSKWRPSITILKCAGGKKRKSALYSHLSILQAAPSVFCSTFSATLPPDPVRRCTPVYKKYLFCLSLILYFFISYNYNFRKEDSHAGKTYPSDTLSGSG